MVLTDVAANRVMIGKPAGYDEADYELLFRAIEAGQLRIYCELDLMPNRKTDSNNTGGIRAIRSARTTATIGTGRRSITTSASRSRSSTKTGSAD